MVFEKVNRPSPFEMDAETIGKQNWQSALKQSIRQEPLGAAYFWLMAFLTIYFARPEDWIPGLSTVPIAKVAGILAFLSLLSSLSQIRRRLPQEVIFLILLTVQLFATVPMSPVWPGGALQKSIGFVKVVVIVVVMAFSVSAPKQLYRLIYVQAASAAAIAGVTVIKGRLLGGRLQGVINGSYSNPNDLALAIVISLPLCLALMFNSRARVWKVAWGAAIFWMIYAVVLTASRGAFIALLVTAVVCLWEFAIRGHRHYLILPVGLAAVVIWSFFGVELGQRLKGTFDEKSNVASAYGSSKARQALFWRSIEVTKEHPFFGIGPGNFQVVSGNWHDTHNSYTQMSSEGGVPALILYLSILGCGFKNLRATKRISRGQREQTVLARALQASLTGFVVGSIFMCAAFHFIPYLLVAYTTAALLIAKKSALRLKNSEPIRKETSERESYANPTQSKMDWLFN